ncbi:MAG: hypothetical protein WCX82_03775 [archaeon]|jgi:hypothetical protein
MNNIFLDVYLGSKLAESISSDTTISNLFTYNNLFYLGIFLIGTFFIFFVSFFLIPKLFRNPQNYFKRYIVIREEMANIDELYTRKKMSFEDYSFAQFHYAKEYEHIIVYLSKFPQYKEKLQSYKISVVKIRETEESKLNNTDKQQLSTINYYVDLLRNPAVFYQKKEIYQAFLDEGYIPDIAEKVVSKLEDMGVEFASQDKDENHKINDLVNSLLASKKSELNYNFNTSINLKDLSTNKKTSPNFGETTTTFSKLSKSKTENKDEKPLFWSTVKGIFKSKERPHTVTEINDIFKDIETTLKEKK